MDLNNYYDNNDDENHKDNNSNPFECSICLDMASDPIVTCCGHLFWWPCFSRVKRVRNGVVREFPVCKGEAKDSAIIPIYINNSRSASRSSTEPLRPKAKRVERRARAQQLFLAISSASCHVRATSAGQSHCRFLRRSLKAHRPTFCQIIVPCPTTTFFHVSSASCHVGTTSAGTVPSKANTGSCFVHCCSQVHSPTMISCHVTAPLVGMGLVALEIRVLTLHLRGSTCF